MSANIAVQANSNEWDDGTDEWLDEPEPADLAPDEIEPEPFVAHPARPRPRLRMAIIVAAVLALVAMVAIALWSYSTSTFTYGMSPVNSGTSQHLARIRAELAKAGAPEAALRQIDVAAQPGVNVGDAIEALVTADKALQVADGTVVQSPAYQELLDVLRRLESARYGRNVSITLPGSYYQVPTLLPITP